jgi:hypothetical protein
VPELVEPFAPVAEIQPPAPGAIPPEIREVPIGVADDYASLVAVLRARKEALNISFECIDAVSGVCSGYAAKLLGPTPCKSLGTMSLGAILQTLGLKLLIVEDVAALARVQSRYLPRSPRFANMDSKPRKPRKPRKRHRRRDGNGHTQTLTSGLG